MVGFVIVIRVCFITCKGGQVMRKGEKAIRYKTRIRKYKKEWDTGNGQCHVCGGCKPGDGWRYQRYHGHEFDCEIAQLMQRAGLHPVYRHENPDYAPYHVGG